MKLGRNVSPSSSIAGTHRRDSSQTVRSFYEKSPFDWVEWSDPEAVEHACSSMLRHFVASAGIGAGQRITDIGCGPGRNLLWLMRSGATCVGLDLTHRALKSVQRHGGANIHCVQGNCLALPLRPACSELTVCDGVLHHTADPFAGFAEIVRITKPGGYLYIHIYRDDSLYPWLYKGLGRIMRAMRCFRAGAVVVDKPLHAVYFLVRRIIKRDKLTWSQTYHIFADYFLTPIVHWYSFTELKEWFQQLRLAVIEHDTYGNVHRLLLQREISTAC